MYGLVLRYRFDALRDRNSEILAKIFNFSNFQILAPFRGRLKAVEKRPEIRLF